MFPRKKRLTRKTFPASGARAHRATSAHFSAVAPTTGAGYAVVISKKVIRLATKRHHVRRRVLGCLTTLPLPEALVVYVRSGAQDLTPTAMRQEIGELLSKMRTSRTIQQ